MDTNSNCDNCYGCYYCCFCDFCDFCDYCDYCLYCYYCKNIRMTEYNYFCWSEKYDDEKSFQQKRYRVFNVEVTEEEYNSIDKIHHKLEFDPDESYDTRFKTAFRKMWDKLTDKEKQEYYDIPHFDWYGFTFITGIEKEEHVEKKAVEEEIITLNGKKYKLVEE